MPISKTKVTLGDRAFSCAAPKIWNNLPLSIRNSQSIISFKTELKTHLFACASFSSHISVNYFIVHYLVNDLSLSKHGALFKKRSRVYLHSYCAI